MIHGATILSLALAAAGAPSEEDILRGADARIQEHRTAEATLRILGVDGQAIAAGQEVRIEQVRHEFLFGCNIFILHQLDTPEQNAAYERLYSELLNYATLPFYWWGYESKPGEPGASRIEEIAKWCKEHNITVKGHPLAWNYQDPQWIPKDLELARSLQMARIFREVNQFKGLIDIWDVVNEATAYERPECLKNSPVLTGMIRHMGVGNYVRQAFTAARAANPKATLVINDYREEEDFAAKIVNELVDDQRQPMYDVIGIQSHQHGGAWPVQHIWQVCDRFARYGKPVHFTETTFLSGKLGWNLADATPGFKWESTPEGEKWQAEQVARFYTVLFSHPAVQAITWWDFADQKAWQRAPAGLVRGDVTPKPAYDALKALIKGKWWTKTAVNAAADGAVKFRGFYGDYEIAVGRGDGSFTGRFTLGRKATGPIEVRLVEVRVR